MQPGKYIIVAMTYILNKITIRTDNSDTGVAKINELWNDIIAAKLPLLHDNKGRFQPGLSPISQYSNYASDESGEYDLTIMTVCSEFFADMERRVARGQYIKYDISDDIGDIAALTKRAWQFVWTDSESGKIRRAFTYDYESTVPAEYTHDGRAHCYLYIALKK